MGFPVPIEEQGNVPGRMRLLSILFAILALATPGSLSAQSARRAEVGVYLPWRVSAGFAAANAYQNCELPRTQGEAYLEKLRRITDVFREAKVVNPPPPGIAIKPAGGLCYMQGDDPKGRVQGLITLGILPYYGISQGEHKTGEGMVLQAYANTFESNVWSFWPDSKGKDDEGEMFFPRQKTGEVAGFAIYAGTIVLTKRTQPLCVPVSQERWLRFTIRQAEEFLAELLDSKAERQQANDIRRAEAEQDLQKWLAGRSERRKHAEARCQEFVKLNKAWMCEQRIMPQYEKEEREGEEARKAWIAKLTQELTGEEEQARSRVMALRAELAALTPEQRAAQAFLRHDWAWVRPGFGQAPFSGLCRPPSKDCQPLVSPNRDFFDRSLPRTALQLLVFTGRGSEFDPEVHGQLERGRPLEPISATLLELRRRVDWQRIASLLE